MRIDPHCLSANNHNREREYELWSVNTEHAETQPRARASEG